MKAETNPAKSARRSFIKSMLVAGVAPMVVPSRLFGKDAPSNMLTVGFIGVGGHGTRINLQNFLGLPDCRATVVCDTWGHKMESAAKLVDEQYKGKGCRKTQDFREVIDDPSLDAIVISTPDHWHVPMSKMALKAGKHVFCEKPTMTIGEGQELVKAVKKSGKTFQTGLEDRSLTRYHKMVEWVRNGAIGDLYHMDVTLPPGQVHDWEPEAAVPDDLNWKLWRGPAPEHHYTETRTHGGHWRYIRDYSTGIVTDWGTHLADTAQLAANDPNGCAIEAKAWARELTDKAQTDIPSIYEIHYRYSNGITMKLETARAGDLTGKTAAIRFQGSKGWVAVNGWQGAFAASDPQILKTKYDPDQSKHFKRPEREQRNFVDCIRSGEKPTYAVDILQELCTTLHMGVMSADLGRPLYWDPSKQAFKNDSEANKLTKRALNKDWMSA